MPATSPKELQKFARLFELISLLSRPPYYTALELADKLAVSKKTIYNYLKLLDSVGFQTDTNRDHRHFLHLERPIKDDEILSQEEAEYLQTVLWEQGDIDPIRNQLLLKFNKQFSLVPVIQNTTRFTTADHRKKLSQAMANSLRVHLRNYTDAKGEVGDRYVEPIDFLEDFAYLYAHDVNKGEDRRYRLNRIGVVEISSEKMQGDHSLVRPDAFGWTGREKYHLRLRLSPLAAQLLHEEYPLTRPYIIKHKDNTYLDIEVCGFPPVARFVCGLGPKEVQIEEVGDWAGLLGFVRERWGEGW
ncbi:MAG: WYL domain-containing protein [Bacteroidota bacterium]